MDVLITILGAGIGAGIMGIILEWLKRRWRKADEKEAKEEAGEQATIADLKADIKELAEEIREDRETTKAVVESQKAIMEERMRYLSICYVKAKKISVDDKLQFKRMHKAYKQLPDANGDMDPVYETVNALPTEEG